MSNRRQPDPRYRSYPTPPSNSHQQPEQFIPSVPMTQDHYPSYPNQYTHPTYPEDPQPHQPSSPPGSYPPYAEDNMSFPQPHLQRSSVGPPATYFAPPQSMPHSSIGSHQSAHQDTSGGSSGSRLDASSYSSFGGSADVRDETSGYPSEPSSAYYVGARQGTSGYPPTIGSSRSHRAYSVGGSVTGSADSESYSVSPQAAYTGAASQPQGWDPTGHEEGQSEEYDGFRPKGPSSSPVFGYPRRCRYPGCNNNVFFDRQVNEYREWCGEQHMWDAVANRVERPCRQCEVWPRRNGYRFCSGNVCRYTYRP